MRNSPDGPSFWSLWPRRQGWSREEAAAPRDTHRFQAITGTELAQEALDVLARGRASDHQPVHEVLRAGPLG